MQTAIVRKVYGNTQELRDQIARLLERGHTHDEIAEIVGRVRSTVGYHIEQIQAREGNRTKQIAARRSPFRHGCLARAGRKKKQQDGRAISVEADFEAVVAQSPMLMAWDRYLATRPGTPAARRALAALRETTRGRK